MAPSKCIMFALPILVLPDGEWVIIQNIPRVGVILAFAGPSIMVRVDSSLCTDKEMPAIGK